MVYYYCSLGFEQLTTAAADKKKKITKREGKANTITHPRMAFTIRFPRSESFLSLFLSLRLVPVLSMHRGNTGRGPIVAAGHYYTINRTMQPSPLLLQLPKKVLSLKMAAISNKRQ